MEQMAVPQLALPRLAYILSLRRPWAKDPVFETHADGPSDLQNGNFVYGLEGDVAEAGSGARPAPVPARIIAIAWTSQSIRPVLQRVVDSNAALTPRDSRNSPSESDL